MVNIAFLLPVAQFFIIIKPQSFSPTQEKKENRDGGDGDDVVDLTKGYGREAAEEIFEKGSGSTAMQEVIFVY